MPRLLRTKIDLVHGFELDRGKSSGTFNVILPILLNKEKRDFIADATQLYHLLYKPWNILLSLCFDTCFLGQPASRLSANLEISTSTTE